MRVLDLFSGIGGFSLGLERAGFETVAFCEYDEAARKVLRLRYPNVPIFPDIRELKGDEIEADVITGGYPCQPFSVAGKRGGATDHRHLWPEMYRIIKAVRPRWVIAENVAGHVSMGLDAVLSDMEAENYTCWPFVIPACAVDAKHRRDRVWIVANANGNSSDTWGTEPTRQQRKAGITDGGDDVADTDSMRGLQPEGRKQDRRRRASNSGEILADTSSEGLERQREVSSRTGAQQHDFGDHCWWPTEPAVGRVAHGIPNRVDRLKQLGNSVVPQIPELIGRAIMAVEHGN